YRRRSPSGGASDPSVRAAAAGAAAQGATPATNTPPVKLARPGAPPPPPKLSTSGGTPEGAVRRVGQGVTAMHDAPWEHLLTAFEGKLPPQALDTWVRPGRVLVHRDDRLEIGVPSQFIRGYLVEHYLNDLQGAATTCFGPSVRVTISVDP